MTRRRATFWSLVTTLIILGLTSYVYKNADLRRVLPEQIQIQPGFYRVIEVVDGDTISVDMNGTVEKVRFIGVDTPETHKPNTPVQCYGPEASAFSRQLLSGKSVRLEADPTNNNRDRYDRLLRYVYTEDDSLVEEKLISQGYGFAYTSFAFQKTEQFVALQNEAERTKQGLWQACTAKLTNGRWQTEFSQ